MVKNSDEKESLRANLISFLKTPIHSPSILQVNSSLKFIQKSYGKQNSHIFFFGLLCKNLFN